MKKVDSNPAAESQYEWIAEKTEVIAFKDGDTVRVFSSVCPHMGAQLCLDRKARKLVCPWHGLSFDLDSGTSDHPRYRCLKEFKAEVVDDKIHIQLSSGGG